MKTQKTYQPSAEEQTIIDIMKRLSPSRSSELLDFTEFLTRREVKDNLNPPDHQSLTEAEVSVNEKKWDKLFAKTEAKGVMREMAEEAGEDYRKGRTTEISVTKDGRLTASNTQFRA
jgi:hypothetical protein